MEDIAAAQVVLEVGPVVRGPFRDMDEVEELNRRKGFHWFSSDSMRFFSSRSGSLIGGRFFVSSEARGFTDQRKGYTVRMARVDGSIDDVSPEGLDSGFLAFDTSASARRFAEKLASKPVTVRLLEGRPVVFVGDCIAGSRFYDAAGALELAGELTGRKGWVKPVAQYRALWTAYRALGEVDGLEVPRRQLRTRIDRITARLEKVVAA